MTKRSSLKLLAACISGILIGTSIILACAGGWWEEYGQSNFTPEAFVSPSYKPLFYSYNSYYEIGFDDNHDQRFNKQVTEDWVSYFDKKIKPEELNYLLFQTTTASIDSITKGLTKNEFVPAPAKDFEILKNKKNKKLTVFLNYLKLAKTCETFALTSDDDWNYEQQKRIPRKSSFEICSPLKTELNATKDEFIKQRIWFQLTRALYFNESYRDCIEAFDAQINSPNKNTIYYRSMSYAAGASYKLKEYSKANYYFSLAYNAGDAFKTVSHWSFRPQEEKDWQATLDLCKTNQEKITLWQILGVQYGDELRSMEEIVKLDPTSEKLDLLLSRSVNKIENGLFNFGTRSEFTPEHAVVVSEKKLKIFVQNLLAKPDLAKPYMWNMALGYLETMDGHYEKAKAYLNEARKTTTENSLAMEQLRLLFLINKISSLKLIDEKTENELLPEIRWLVELNRKKDTLTIRNSNASEWFLKTVAQKYRGQKDLMKAEFFQTTSDYYVKEEQLNAMKLFLKKPNKSPYEELCASLYSLSYEDLSEFDAIYKTYQNKIDEAIVLMEQAGSHAQKELLSNPFNGGIKDCHDCDHAKPQKVKYSKLVTLKKIKEIKSNMQSDPYNNALLLGNLFYSISYFGSSRLFYECNVIGVGHSDPEYINYAFRNKLLDMQVAKTYYTIALGSAKNPEQKAKCFYMLSKCERNDWYTISKGPKDGQDFIAWQNFKYLKQFANTVYYKEVLKECGYFRSYAGN